MRVVDERNDAHFIVAFRAQKLPPLELRSFLKQVLAEAKKKNVTIDFFDVDFGFFGVSNDSRRGKEDWDSRKDPPDYGRILGSEEICRELGLDVGVVFNDRLNTEGFETLGFKTIKEADVECGKRDVRFIREYLAAGGSPERIVEQSKERYYETLQISSQNWHEGNHDAWPYVNYLLFTLKEMYSEFEERYENTDLPRGEKSDSVRRATLKLKSFHIRELQKSCPEVSIDMIRKVLAGMRNDGTVECTGRGKHARWRLIG